MRITPRPSVSVAVWLGYAVLILVLGLLLDADFEAVGSNAEDTVRVLVIPIAVGAVLLAGLTTWFGWWRPVLLEQHRSERRWPIIVPLLGVLAAVLLLLGSDVGALGSATVLALLAGVLLVGFTEELAIRGVVLVGLRGRLTEGWVWFLSSVMFALMHSANAFLGASVADTAQQVGATFFVGTMLYIVRRTTGSLIWAMAVHAFWDFGSLVHTNAPVDESPMGMLGGALVIVVPVLAVAVVYWVIKGADERIDVAKPSARVA